MKNKKAYIFILDGIMALLILTIGFIIISATYSNKPTIITTRNIANDLLNVMAVTKIREVCPESCVCTELQSVCVNDILNLNNTFLELAGELYYGSNYNTIKLLFDNIIVNDKLINDELYSFSVYIHDGGDCVEVYPDVDTNTCGYSTEEQEAKVLVSSKKIVMGYYINGQPDYNTIYWGPYIIEIRTWQN